jgi:hypothetical protein
MESARHSAKKLLPPHRKKHARRVSGNKQYPGIKKRSGNGKWHGDCTLQFHILVRRDANERFVCAIFTTFADHRSTSMTTNGKMLTAVFQHRSNAIKAFDWLQKLGYRPGEINVLMTEGTRGQIKEEKEEHFEAGNMGDEGAAVGGAIGAVGGATLGAIIALATAIVLPGLSIIVVAGPIVALAASGAGAVAGGAVGGLIGLGIPASNAKAYEEALRNGGVVLGVIPHSADDAGQIEKYFAEHHADNVVFA